jgi:preprotein translocase subunit SecY
MAVAQAVGMVFSWRTMGAFAIDSMFLYLVAALTMVAGTMFIMWMSELLTEKGLGNGASFIIFANILSALPGGIETLYYASLGNLWRAFAVAAILIIFVAMVAFTVLISEGQRKLAVQYSKKMVGRQTYGGQSSFIPVKVNLAGVLPMIFAMSILGFVDQIKMFFPNLDPDGFLMRASDFLNISSPTGAPIYVLLIFAFTFFYASFSINPVEMAENLKKNGGFMPGIRPGKPTSDYIARTVKRMSWVGASCYALVAITPIIVEWTFGVPVGFGGTTIIIVVGVALEIVKKLESQLLMRNYKGFLAS